MWPTSISTGDGSPERQANLKTLRNFTMWICWSSLIPYTSMSENNVHVFFNSVNEAVSFNKIGVEKYKRNKNLSLL